MFVGLYNVMSILIRNIIDHADEKFFEGFRAISQEEHQRLNNTIMEIFPELFEKDRAGEYKELVLDNLGDFYLRSRRLIEQAEKSGDFGVLIRLLEKLDLCLSKQIYAEVELSDSYKSIKMLNTNGAETSIRLLPRVSCPWERSCRGSQHFDRLDNYLKNFYYLTEEAISPFEIENIFLPQRMFARAQRKGKLKIGISPLDCENHFQVKTYERGTDGYFSIVNFTGQAILKDKVENILRRSRKEGVDILVFPEMLGTHDICEYARAVMFDSLFEENNEQFPALVVMPSIWKDNENGSVVLDSYGDKVARQLKQWSFPLLSEDRSRRYNEDIRPDYKIYVFHNEIFGRMVIPICKDFITNSYLRRLVDTLKATLILSPSFSTGSYDFFQTMRYSGYADVCSVWINTCAASNLGGAKVKNFDTIGAFYLTGKNSKFDMAACRREESCLKKECKMDCLFTQEVPITDFVL